METNDIKHRISTPSMDIDIRLNDECGNGHEDFAITATYWEPGKPHTDKYMIGGGCCHEEIAKRRPDLIPFIRLHLSDFNGVPMYAAENGFYHLQNGFNRTPADNPKFKAEFCEHYRITTEQFEQLKTVKNKLQYHMKLKELGVFDQWKAEAAEAIKQLETMTGKTFKSTATRSNNDEPTPEELREEERRRIDGYYTPEAEEQRKQAAAGKLLKKLEEERDAEIKKAETEFFIKKQVLEIGGKKALNNCIYYSHSKEIGLNWRGYDNLKPEELQNVIDHLVLPEDHNLKIGK